VRFEPDTPFGRVVKTKRLVHVTDITTEPAYLKGFKPLTRLAELGGGRSLLLVPMLKDDILIGVITIYRQEVQSFTDKQIGLLQNFAAQAVIAIENTRLLNELRQRTDDLTESLEQQTATSEVLRIVSSSSGSLEPVFNAMIENATRLCGAEVGTFALYEGTGFRGVAVYGHSERYAQVVTRTNPLPPGTGLKRLETTGQTVQVVDVAVDAAYEDVRRLNPDFGRVRTALYVPIVKEGALIGAFMIYRHKVLPFSAKQVELVENFAAQAVIAIENARLLNELRQRTNDLTESLEQQTATSEVLKVISSSPGELEPVFNAMLSNAVRICEAKFGNLFLL
jgi:GAF domain-containing protein